MPAGAAPVVWSGNGHAYEAVSFPNDVTEAEIQWAIAAVGAENAVIGPDVGIGWQEARVIAAARPCRPGGCDDCREPRAWVGGAQPGTLAPLPRGWLDRVGQESASGVVDVTGGVRAKVGAAVEAVTLPCGELPAPPPPPMLSGGSSDGGFDLQSVDGRAPLVTIIGAEDAALLRAALGATTLREVLSVEATHAVCARHP